MSVDTYTVFERERLFAQGPLAQVIAKVKRRLGKSPQASFLIFSDVTGKEMDFNFQGTEADVLKRLEVYVSADSPESEGAPGPGRPKLGVVSREVSLLPRHWEWLATQPGGASATLRKLVEEARKKSAGDSDIRRAQERTHKFMSVLAGNCEGYEEALRALYRKDRKTFLERSKTWPGDVREHALTLAESVLG